VLCRFALVTLSRSIVLFGLVVPPGFTIGVVWVAAPPPVLATLIPVSLPFPESPIVRLPVA
jgi:hypothetical protein